MTFTAAVVGLGYWGPNLARNIAANPDFELAALCDTDPVRLRRIGTQYPVARCYRTMDEVLQARPPDLVAIATPVASHHALATAAMEAGCHVLVEKPLARTSAEGRSLVETAERVKRHLFVDHTFLFTSAVTEIRRQVRGGALGNLFYVDSVRISLGLFQPDVDVVWDLAPHDLAILDHVIGQPLRSVRAVGSSHSPRGSVDVAYVHLEYAGALAAHLHLSWLSPVKVRRMIFAGDRQSLIYDDLEPMDKVKIYDRGVEFDSADVETRREVLVNYRVGDMRAPALSVAEALSNEFKDIAETMRGLHPARCSGADGLAVLCTLESVEQSLRSGGAPCVPAAVR